MTTQQGRHQDFWVWGFQFKCPVDLFLTTAGGGSRKFAREDPYGYVWILPSELGTWAQTQYFLVVLGIVSREARENLHIFRNICTTLSQIWCDLRGFHRAKARKKFVIWALLVRIHLLLPLLLHSACYVRVPPYDFRPSPKIHDGGGPAPGAPPVSALDNALEETIEQGGCRVRGTARWIDIRCLHCAHRRDQPSKPSLSTTPDQATLFPKTAQSVLSVPLWSAGI